MTTDGANDAPSIQRAIDTLCRGTGNTLYWLPRHYVIASPIVQDCALMWHGDGWQEAPSDIATARGTWLDIEGAGFKPVTIRGAAAKGSEIKDIAVDQPGQPAPPETGQWTPAPYPHVFNVENVGGYVGFRHIFMDGVSNGIRSFNGGRTVVDGLWGQFFNNDVLYDQETDVSRIYEVHSWPYWSGKLPVIDFQQARHQAIVLGRADSPFVDRIFVFAASSGILIRTGAEGGTATGVEVGMISCDSVVVCVQDDGNGVDMFIGEMRQFGQRELNSAVPYTGATALLIKGQGVFHIGLLSAKLIDAAPVVASNNDACSNVLISQMDVEFNYSRRRKVSLLDAAPCTRSGASTTQIIFGVPPQIRTSSAQILQSSVGGKVFWPDLVAH